MEYAGTVQSIGDDVTEWSVGDRVMGIEAGGCYAERVVTHARQAMPIPTSVDTADAAAIPEVFLTAWDALVVQGGLTSGRWALVHAGASGVGTAAIQIAKAIGARVAVTCSPGKADACRELGADLVLERSPADWLAELQAAVPAGVDVVLDVIGGDEVGRNLRATRLDGTIVQVGLMGGGNTEVNVGLILQKRITWIGTTLRSRPLERKVGVEPAVHRRDPAAVRFGRPATDRRFPVPARRHRRRPSTDGVERQRRQDPDRRLNRVNPSGRATRRPFQTTSRPSAATARLRMTIRANTATANGNNAAVSGWIDPARRPSTQHWSAHRT